MKVRSVKSHMVFGTILMIILLTIVFLIYGSYTIKQNKGRYQKEHELETAGYVRSINEDIASMNSYINSIFTNNEPYQVLCRPKVTEAQWVVAAYQLSNMFRSRTDVLDYFGGVFFYDAALDTMRSEFSQIPTDIFEYRLNEAMKGELRQQTAATAERYRLFEYDERKFVLSLFGYRNVYIGYLISLSDYFHIPDSAQLLILDESGSRVYSQGDVQKASFSNDPTCLIAEGEIDAFHLQLIFVREEKELSFWSRQEFLILFLLVPALCVFALLQIYRLFVRILYQPIDHVMNCLEQMQQETPTREYQRYLSNSVELKEVQIINRRLDELFSEIERLEHEKYRKEREANAARLQYYQLQIRPHFYLNCLTILDSLLNEKNTDTVRQMIYLMSDHIRYTFRDSASMVTLEEEIEEIRAYASIYMIRNGMPILLQMRIGEKEKHCRVPILCVQTFVENSIKYALRTDQVLSIEVKSGFIEIDGRNCLKISITDNGPGFPEEKLKVLNERVTEFQYNSKQVGVDNIKYRMYLIYKEQARLYFYNRPSGGAATEILLPETENEYTDH